MIGIILGILKWIGILLLAILGLILLILLIVLLVPIRYRLQASRTPVDGVITARGKVSWLASVVAVTFAYEGELSWKVRLCGIPLKLGQKDGARDGTDDEIEELSDAQKAERKAQSEAREAEIAALEAELAEKSIHTQAKKKTENNSEIPARKSSEPLTLQTQSVTEEEAPKIPLTEKIRGILQKISEGIHSIPEKIAGVRDKIRSLKEQADTWIQFAKTDEVKLLISTCWKQIKQILRHLLPTNLRISGNYGFADPALTGQITGVICMLPQRYQKNIQLQPHFQEVCLDGECTLKGRIRLGSLLLPVIKILVKPCTWKAYKRFKAITKPKSAEASNSGKKKTTEISNSGKDTSRSSGKSSKAKNRKSNTNQNDPHKGGK